MLTRIHFVKICGIIEQRKKQEFESTVKFACDMMTSGCLDKSLSMEMLFGQEYYFFTSWTSEIAVRKFMQSEEYQLVRSAYDVMGVLRKIEIGYDVEMKIISIHQL